MTAFIIKRFAKGIVIVWFVWSLVFVLVRLTGDPTEWMLPEGAPAASIVALRQSMGLDLPVWRQYLRSFASILEGDFGNSYYYRRGVVGLYAERFASTLALGIPAFSLAIAMGMVMGIVAAVRHNGIIDRVVMSLAIAGYTIPNFVLGILMILIFSLYWRLLPTGGMGTPAHLIMPVMALAMSPMANIARLTRSSLLDTLQKEYLDGARMKGLKERTVILKHAFRNSLIPVVTAMSVQLGTIIGGAVVVETVFAWPGVGHLIVTAARQRDFPTVQYGILLIAISVTVAYILVDVAYGYLDPRIRENYK